MFIKKVVARFLSGLATFFGGKETEVLLDDNADYVGYTTKGTDKKAIIHISMTNPLYDIKSLDDNEGIVVLTGVDAHEILHQVYTDFDGFDAHTITVKYKKYFHSLANITEDAAIEWFAPYVYGGKMLKALYKFISLVYNSAMSLEDANDPRLPEPVVAAQQILIALNHLGNRGAIKGDFASDLGREYFGLIFPIFREAVIEPQAAKRCARVAEMYSTLLPLLEMAGSAVEKMSSMTGSLSEGQSSGSGSDFTIPSNSQQEREQARLDAEANKVKASQNNGTQKGENVSRETSQDTNAKSDSTQNASCGNGAKEKAKGDNTNNAEDNNENKTDAQGKNSVDSQGEDKAEDGDAEHDVSNNQLSDSELQDVLNGLQRAEQQIQREDEQRKREEEKSKREIAPDTPEIDHIDCRDQNHLSCQRLYNTIAEQYSTQSRVLTRALQKAFAGDMGEVANTTFGTKINLKQVASPTLHSNIMQSRIAPKDIADMNIVLLVDMSGSMVTTINNVSNIDRAKEMAIMLYEALLPLNIPMYCMGFTSSEDGDKIAHRVYCSWNSKTKYALASIDADGCNYDAAAIDEATRISIKKHAKHQLLIVISDGTPNSLYSANWRVDGVKETKAAIAEARRKGVDVIGIALNCSHPEAYNTMYGKDYIQISTANDATKPLISVIRKVVSRWQQ